ncbi:MAG: SGNH/GDSL hydrolase family protein, partial [Bacilli bacterium]|nr:SGNH/GDSL hydrolase family protein [Bacilli bacterium]
PTDSDYVVVMGGGNDMMESISVGSRFEVDNTYVVSGALFQIIVYLQTNLPNAKIMFITEPPIGAEMHDAYDPYLNIIMEICEMGHIPCFNMHANFGLNPNIPQIREIYWLEDYVHLTETGQQYMSQKIQNFLENEVVNNNKNANSLNGYKLMILSASEYASLSSKDTNTIYITKDNKAYLGSLLILGGGTSSGGDSGDTPNEGAIDQTLWDTFFKIKKYASVSYPDQIVETITNDNPVLMFEGNATASLITNLSEEGAVYDYGTAISHVATTLDAGKTITINFDLESTNVKIHNMGFYHSGGSFGTMLQTGGVAGNYNVTITNTTDATIDINGIGMMIEPIDTSSNYSLKMTVKSITIA